MISFLCRVKGCVAITFVSLLASCTPSKYFFLNSEGIVSYNRNTGQFEMLWDAKTGKQNADSIQRNCHCSCDSCVSKKELSK